MVDRFADGRPDHAQPPVDPSDPQGWHGGDLSGLIARVPALAAMGVRTLWLSPISQSRQAKIGDWGAYHGYWVHNLGALEPRLATPDELRALSATAHAHGMRLVLDVVWNHVAPDSPLRAQQPTWFHQRGDIQRWDDPVQRIEGDVHGLPDLAQEQPQVRAHLLDATLLQLAGGADGLRIDAVGHMPLDALAALNDALDDKHPGGVWTLAEDFSGDPLRLRHTLKAGHFDAIFDFSLRYALIDAVCAGKPARLAATLELDRLWDDALAPGDEAPALVTFIDNHDTERVLTACGGDVARADAALTLLFTLRGTPSLTWGTEALQSGAREAEVRASMRWDTPAPRAAAIRTLAEARAEAPALRGRAGRTLQLQDDHLLLVRGHGAQQALVLLNTSDSALRIDAPAALVGQPLRLQLAPGPQGPSLLPGGTLPPTLSVPARGVGVWVLEQAGPIGRRRLVSWPVVATAPVPPGHQLRIVGAGPELGAWDPAQGVILAPDGAGHHIGTLLLPQGGVPAMKLVIVGPNGDAPRFEPGPDRSPLLPDAASTLTLPWGAPTAWQPGVAAPL